MTNLVPLRALTPGGPPAPVIVTSFRAGDVADDVLDSLRAYQAFARTCALLQRSLDAAQEQKRRITKELGRAVKAAWEAFTKHHAPEEWRPVDDAIAAAREGTATDEQVATLLKWCRDERTMFLGHDGVKRDKESALKAANGRIEDLEIALRRVILEQPGQAKDEVPQMDLPGVKPQGKAGVWDAKVRKTVVDVLDAEIVETRAKATAEGVSAEERAAAEAQAAADAQMRDALKAMGIADDALPEDDLEDIDETDGDAEDADADPQAELPIDTTATEVDSDAELDAAEKHEALGGKLPAKRGRKPKAAS